MGRANQNRIAWTLALIAIAVGVNFIVSTEANVSNMVCYYDATSSLRPGAGKMSLSDLEPALQFCNYLVYGYAAIDNATYRLTPLHPQLDLNLNHYNVITSLKLRYPNVRILLSVGGDRDVELLERCEHSKYLLLLEDEAHRRAFAESAVATLVQYGFDGLDLAWQFPKQPPKKVEGTFKKAWTTFKGWFTGAPSIDERVADHKEQFTALVRQLKSAFQPNGFYLTLTILPHVDGLSYVDSFVMTANVEFINLATFDFKTPERDPKVADYAASLYEIYDRDLIKIYDLDERHNVNYQVQRWLNDSVTPSKINVGIPTYGRAWTMTLQSGITGYPPIRATNGSAPAGKQTGTRGLLSWPEICEKINRKKEGSHGREISLRQVTDRTNRLGTYGYHAVDEETSEGLWVSFEEPYIAALKANYVRAKGLGGVALFDITLDDFKGTCAIEKYPILRFAKYAL